MPHAGQNFAMLTPMGAPTGVRVGGAAQSTGLRLAMGRHAPPKRPTSSTIGAQMKAPREMKGNAGIRGVTTPAKVKKAPMSTWRRIKASPATASSGDDMKLPRLRLVRGMLGRFPTLALHPHRQLVE